MGTDLNRYRGAARAQQEVKEQVYRLVPQYSGAEIAIAILYQGPGRQPEVSVR